MRTKGSAVNQVAVWLEWLPKKVEDSNYKDLMDYIGHLQEKQARSPAQINRILQAISHYYECHEIKNVAIGTRVKGVVQKAKVPVFTEKYSSIKCMSSFIPKSRQGLLSLLRQTGIGLDDLSGPGGWRFYDA